MKKILYILSALTLALSSCVKEEGPSAGAKLPNPEGVGVLNVKIEIPETAIATRALSKDFDFTNSTLHLAVFDGSTLSEYALAKNVGPTTGEVDGKTVTYQFTVNLTLNAAPIHVHMVLNGPDNLSYGYEDELMSRLSVSGNTPAYWGYVDLPDGITAKQVWDSATQSYEYVKEDGKYVVEDVVAEKFQKVPMVRNFAWLTVGTSSSVTNFTLDGIVLLNEPKEGTVAPYNRSTHAFMTDYKTYDYSGIVSAYSGNMLTSETFDGTVPTTDADFVDPSSGVFMYERTAPTGTQAKTTIIARGKYNGETVYYKIDLADADGYYTVYRNFHYNITITNVAKKGSATIADAIQSGGTADPTTDTDISSLDDISNGVNRLYVQYVDTTVTSAQDMVLRYKFIPDINSSNAVDNNAVTLTVGNKGSYGEAIEGSACTKATSDETYGGSSGWRQVTFKTTGPGTSEKHQSITVTGTSNSTSVKIVVTVRVIPVQTLSVECVNSDATKLSTARRNAIRDTTAAPLDVRTTIPVGLPESIFPLVFDIEVVQKSLTPRAGAYLPVTSGKSYSGSGKATYMFQRTLTYSEYVSLTPSDSKVSFSSLFKSNIAASASEVYVANQYFNTGSASFTNYHVAKFSHLMYHYSYTDNSDGTQTAKVSKFSFDMEEGYVMSNGSGIPVHVYIEGGTADTTPTTLRKDDLRGEGWYIYVPYNSGPQNKSFEIVPDSDATSIYVQLSTDESSPVEYETAELRGNASFVMSTVTFYTNSTYFGESWDWGWIYYDNSETSDEITLTFNNIYSRSRNYLAMDDGTFTITSTSKNIARVDIHYYSANGRTYDPQSVTADSGTFNDDYTDWRAHGVLTDRVTFTMDANTGWDTRTAISSIVVYLAN